MRVCVERIDPNLSWVLIEDLINEALLRKSKARVISFVENRGIFMGDNWPETTWLDSHGTRMICSGSLVFHRWSPLVGTKIVSAWLERKKYMMDKLSAVCSANDFTGLLD